MAKKHRKPLGQGLLGKTPKALRPTSRKSITRQSTRLVKKLYKPALHDLRAQEKKLDAVNEKRRTDNQYYLNWLGTQQDQLRAHASAAETQVMQSQAEMQSSAQGAMAALRSQLVEAGAANVGNVSNSEQADAHDVTPEAQRASSMIQNERTRTNQQIQSNRQGVDAAGASNFALMAASDARRQSEHYRGLKDLADARQKVKLERAAKGAEEVARLLEMEITKAQSVVEMRAQAAQMGLSLKDFKLRKKEFGFNKQLQMGQLSETIRHNMATENLTGQGLRNDARDDRADNANDRRDSQHDRNQDRHDNQQENQENQHQIKRAINNNVQMISSRNQLQEMLASNPNKAVQWLVKHGSEPIFARAAVDLTSRGGQLSSGSMRNLRGLGFNIPNGWKP